MRFAFYGDKNKGHGFSKASETKNSFETRERGEAPTRELVRFLFLTN